MTFRDPWILLLILAYFFVIFIVAKRYKDTGFIFPTDELIKTFKGSLKLWLVKRIGYLRIICMVLVIFAMAGPQKTKETVIKKEGVSIILAIDCSSTMVANNLQLGLEDLVQMGEKGKSREIKRIDAVKEVAKDFISSRENDLIGIVAFASEAFIVSPLTFDYEWLAQSLQRVEVGMIKDGTAIGSGVLSSLNSLKDVKAKSKVIILLTDGINNFGRIPPLVAAKAARALGIKIYTIGVVSKGGGLQDADDGSGRKVFKRVAIDVDEEEMRKIAKLTDGKYFRATDMNTLRESYKEIDRLEKTGIEEKGYEEYVDIFQYFLFAALIFLLLDILLRNTFLRRIP